jgi:hypothetical protein
MRSSAIDLSILVKILHIIERQKKENEASTARKLVCHEERTVMPGLTEECVTGCLFTGLLTVWLMFIHA